MEEKQEKEKLGFWEHAQKALGFLMLVFMVYFHLYVRPVNMIIIAIPLVLIGIDIKKIIR